MRRLGKLATCLALSAAMVCTMTGGIFAWAADFVTPESRILTTLKETAIAPGVEEQQITTLDKESGRQTKSYLAIVDPSSSAGILASYKDYNSDGKWGMQTLRDQAAAAAKATGKKIVFGINGDYFNMNNGQPLGALVMGGKVVNPTNNEPYFAVMKDGSYQIREGHESLDDVQEAVSGPIMLIKDGQINEGLMGDHLEMPRCAVGITAEGKVVFFTADGRQAPVSAGFGLAETIEMMKGAGCVDAIYLDGGGSATFASRPDGADELVVRNSPSDGVERKISSAILVYSEAKATSEFDHAALSPSQEIYTPGSTVQFTAVGADSANSHANLPENGEFVLADESMGSIDAVTGEFKSNGTTGVVRVNYMVDGKRRGTTEVEVQMPDSISFNNSEVALGFDEESDLGLVVQYQNRQINYNDGDFEWTISDSALGTMTGNIFKSSEGATVTGTVTCAFPGNNISGELTVVVGLEPTVVMDFEDGVSEDGSTVAAEDYWTFNKALFNADGGIVKRYDMDDQEISESNSKLIVGHYFNWIGDQIQDRGAKVGASIASLSDGDPVRFGAHSLKIDYDFTNAGNSTSEDVTAIEGACVGFSEGTSEIPGSPTAIGMYVYAPEGTANLWMRIRLLDRDGNIKTVDFHEPGTDAITSRDGINWVGWKYIEADLRDLQGPFRLMGGETIRPMYHVGLQPQTPGAKTNTGEALPKSQRKGSIYVDNLQFVYGANTADTKNPSIGAAYINGEDLVDDAVIKSNVVNIQASAFDAEDRYATGIDESTANLYIDGMNVSKTEAFSFRDGQFFLSNYSLSSGEHSVKFYVRDGAGNEASKTFEFVVEGDDLTIPTVKAVGRDAEVTLGGTAYVDVSSKNAADINSLKATVKLGKDFSQYEVKYAEGFEEDKPAVFDSKENTVTLFAKRAEGIEVASDVIAVLEVKIPNTLTAQDSFNFSVPEGQFEVADADGVVTVASFHAKNKKYSVVAKYAVSSDLIVEGEDAKFYVTDAEGAKIKGIGLYAEDGTKLGTTGRKGSLYTSAFRDPQTIRVYAMDDQGMRSFIYETKCYKAAGTEDGAPFFVNVNASVDSTSSKNITWATYYDNEGRNSYARVSEKTAGAERDWKTFEGTNEPLNFTDTTILVNKVEVAGLKSDTEYVYQVGDGDVWSKEYTFKTNRKGTNAKFAIIGDAQATTEEDRALSGEILDSLYSGENVSFDALIQTGDFVESDTIYSDWSNALAAFDRDDVKLSDFIHVLGNHESHNDAKATAAKKLFGSDDLNHYSVTYGNTHIMVLGYSGEEDQIAENAKWLVSDAAASDAQWKILVMHQPPYGTNGDDATIQQRVNKYIPAACDQAGIDFVFSGHDHSYARTAPMVDGQVDENGTVYYIVGHTGGKSYGVTENPEYNFVKCTNEFDGLYHVLEATDSEFKVVTYNRDGTEFDSYTKKKEGCKNSLHTYLVEDDGYLTCKNCGHAEKIGSYTGLVHDAENGIARYLMNGNFVEKQWVPVDNDNYYIKANGYAATGSQIVDRVAYTFDNEGKLLKGSFFNETVTNNQNASEEITRYYYAGQPVVHWYEIDGAMYYFKKTSNNESIYDLGRMYTGDGVKARNVKTVANNQNRSYVFAPDGKLVLGAFVAGEVDANSFRYYWGDTYLKGEQNIQGYTYVFDNDGLCKINDLSKVTISNVANQVYTGKALKPAVELTFNGQKLVEGLQYTVKYSDNKLPGTATITISAVADHGFVGQITKTFNIVVNADNNGNDNGNNGGNDNGNNNGNNGGNNGGNTNTDTSDPVPPTKAIEAPKGLKVKSSTYNSASLTWTKSASEVNGYYIFASKSGGAYKLIGKTTGAVKYTAKSLKTGSTYRFKVSAYIVDKDGKAVASSVKSNAAKVKPSLKRVTLKKKVSVSKTNKAKISWKKVAGAKGYEYRIYKGKKLVRKGVVKGKSKVSATSKKLSKKTKYTVKVRAYTTVSGKKVYGSYSKKKSFKTRK